MQSKSPYSRRSMRACFLLFCHFVMVCLWLHAAQVRIAVVDGRRDSPDGDEVEANIGGLLLHLIGGERKNICGEFFSTLIVDIV